MVLQLERCIEDPEGELARTFAFLGVDPGFVPRTSVNRVNEGRRSDLTIHPDLIDYAKELYADDRKLLSRVGRDRFDLWPEVAP